MWKSEMRNGSVWPIPPTAVMNSVTEPRSIGWLQLEDGGRINARAMIIASGARYRKPSIVNVSQFEGAGVYYSASRMGSQLCAGDEVAVVGGGNSAGQAAVFLAETAKHVHLLVRKD